MSRDIFQWDQVAQSSIQPGLEPFQGGGSHSFSGQPGPGFHHPRCCFLHRRPSRRLKSYALPRQSTDAKGQPNHPERVRFDSLFPLPQLQVALFVLFLLTRVTTPGWKRSDNGHYLGGWGAAHAHVALPRCHVLLGALLHLLHRPEDAGRVGAGNSSRLLPGLLSRPTQWVRGGGLFRFSARCPGVTTTTREAWLKTKRRLELGVNTEGGNLATSERSF